MKTRMNSVAERGFETLVMALSGSGPATTPLGETATRSGQDEVGLRPGTIIRI
ncbi:unnamed protein product [Dovyalis caffra]|uniref:Uncharacterized protein n=1 Tax=Dovyalis caffra TaxID=77055 RepID=A0AAV1RIE6_9ROSI|nr:unnamed protein product [Dovyalis caffra]